MALLQRLALLLIWNHSPLSLAPFPPAASAGIVLTNTNYYYVGEVITLHCYADSKFVDLRFSYANDIEVPMKYVTVINDTYARMDRPAMAEDYAKTNYICWHDFNEAMDVDSHTIETEYRPENVTNFSCAINSTNNQAVMTWDLGVNYKRNHTIAVSADWTKHPEVLGSWIECKCPSKTTCVVDISENDSPTHLALRVKVTNRRRLDSATAIFVC